MNLASGCPVDQGRELNQKVHLGREGAYWSVTFESRSGVDRNRDYDPALALVLARLGAAGGRLERALLDSSVVESWSDDARELPLPGGCPRRLTRDGADDLRLELCRAQAADKFRSPGATGSGTARKRIKLLVSLPIDYGAGAASSLVFEGRLANGAPAKG